MLAEKLTLYYTTDAEWHGDQETSTVHTPLSPHSLPSSQRAITYLLLPGLPQATQEPQWPMS